MEKIRPLTRRGFLGATAALVACTPQRTMPGTIVGASEARGHRLRRMDFPEASETIRTDVVIVGGGIAGLAAARTLRDRHFVLLELEDHCGGNAWHGDGYPWGAHYVTQPTSDAHEVRELFEELGAITPYSLVADPSERLFISGRWQEGLLPRVGASSADLAQYTRFAERMHVFKNARGNDGKRAFTIPIDRSSRDPAFTRFDTMTAAAWLDAEGFDSLKLRWYVDYACRDDFGGTLDQVSAWAAIHYFAARDSENESVVTWPEGNGWLADRLRDPSAASIRSGMTTWRVKSTPGGVTVDAFDSAREVSVRFEAARAIVCTPSFVTERIVPGYTRAPDLTHGTWAVANLVVDTTPEGEGFAPAWDNVFYGARSLGYVNASHQRIARQSGPVVLTWYTAICDEPRREALTRNHADWCAIVLADMRRAHPGIDAAVQRIDVCVWGHGMVKPTPGLITSDARRAMAEPMGNIHFAHSDLSGLSIFEEAYTRGVLAAKAV